MMEDLNTEAGLRATIVNKAIERLGEDKQTLELLYVNNDQVPHQIRAVFKDLLDGTITQAQATEKLGTLRRDSNVQVPDFGGTFRTIPEGPFAGMVEVVPHNKGEPKQAAKQSDELREAQEAEMLDKHNKWIEFSAKFNIKEGNGFTVPSDQTIQQSWDEFRSYLALGDGNQFLDLKKVPDWFSASSGVAVQQSVSVVGAGLTRQQQEELLAASGQRMATAVEAVSLFAFQRIGICMGQEKMYQALSSIADELGKSLLSKEVVQEFNLREDKKVTAEIMKRFPNLGSFDAGPHDAT